MVRVKILRVTFFHPDLGIGGAERLVLDVATALADQGMEVSFYTNHFDPSHAFGELKSGRFPVNVVGDWLPRSIFGYFQALCAYVRMAYLALTYVLFFKHFDQPDVYVVDQIPVAVFFLKFTQPKVIYYCHHPDLLASPPGGTLKTLYRKPIDWIEEKGVRKSDMILANSKYTVEVFRRTFPDIRGELRILYPTISRAYEKSVGKITRKSLKDLVEENGDVDPSKSVVFLSINRFHPAKKLELAVEALDALRTKMSPDEFRDVRLVIAGGYDPNSQVNKVYFAELVTLVGNKRLQDKVIFVKSPSDKLKADLLVTCDCLVYTPVKEHFGIVPLEAMAASKPVIAINSGGPKETVEHGITGFLSEPNGDSFSEYMLKITNLDLSKRLGENGLKRLEKLFSYDIFCSKIVNIVTDAVCVRSTC